MFKNSLTAPFPNMDYCQGFVKSLVPQAERGGRGCARWISKVAGSYMNATFKARTVDAFKKTKTKKKKEKKKEGKNEETDENI